MRVSGELLSIWRMIVPRVYAVAANGDDVGKTTWQWKASKIVEDMKL